MPTEDEMVDYLAEHQMTHADMVNEIEAVARRYLRTHDLGTRLHLARRLREMEEMTGHRRYTQQYRLVDRLVEPNPFDGFGGFAVGP